MSLGRLSAHSFFFWGVTLLAALAELDAVLLTIRRFHQKDPWVLSLCVMAGAVPIIWLFYLRLQSGLSALTQLVGPKLLGGLQMAADMMCVFANAAVVMCIINLSHR
ncbi:MAG: hypothetical protein ACLPXM_05830 [Terriglobales bacterium]